MADSDWDEDVHNSKVDDKIENNLNKLEDRIYSPQKRKNQYSNETNDTIKVINVEGRFVGRIIGKSGCNIRDLQATTNTRIVLSNRMATVTVKGKLTNVDDAISRIEELCSAEQRPSQSAGWYRKSEAMQTASQPRAKINWDNLKKMSDQRSRHLFGSLPDVVKKLYDESQRLDGASQNHIDKMIIEEEISVNDLTKGEPRNIPLPVTCFEEILHIFPDILKIVSDAGFSQPTPIQCLSWPIIMSGYDFIGIARTGTGKTLAFLLPALIHIDMQSTPRSNRTGPTCLILSPTRELAQQIHEEVGKFKYKNIRSRKDQIMTVERGVEIVIATPGRLNDLLSNNILSLTSVTFLVLDEADRMLDLGFEPEIRKVLLDVRSDRQTVMTSATWPPGVTRLINNYMTDPIQVNIGSLGLTACRTITQLIEFIDEDSKLERIKRFVSEMDENSKALIFVSRKIIADYLTSELILSDVVSGGVQCIHGNREQIDREQAIADFKSGEAKVLIATDVASRGLDISDISHVINYDFPKHMEEYVHRIGRTGRAGKSGIALSFVSRENWSSAQSLIDVLTDSNQYIPDELVLMAERYAAKVREKEMGLNIPGQHNRGTRLCRKCGEPGHLSYNCHK